MEANARLTGFVASAFLLLSGASCGKFSRTTVARAEQEIIEAVIADNDDSRPSVRRGLFQRSSVHLAFIGDMTYPTLVTELRKNAKYRDQAFHEALEDFIRANSAIETQMVFSKKLPDSIVLVPNAQVQRIYETTRNTDEAQLAIRKQFGGIDGTYEVSRAGVDSHRRVALICLSYSNWPGSVRGRFYVLIFDGVKWSVQMDDSIGPSWMS